VRLTATIATFAAISGIAPLSSTARTGGGSTYYTQARTAVCHYFGVYCDQAMRVVGCETGHTYYPWSRNGQYLGIFQMGSTERATYGHGGDVWSQARAAWRYFVASGRDWSPWACKPW